MNEFTINNYREQVAAALRATAFHSPTIYSWFGKQSQRLPRTVQRALSTNIARDYLCFHLQTQLYKDFYCQGFATLVNQKGSSAVAPVSQTPFVEALSTANAGSGYWQAGWEISEIKDTQLVVYRAGLELWVHPGECLLPNSGQIVPGMQLSLHFPKEFLSISPGYYMALSNKEFQQDEFEGLLRLYWNFTAEGALSFMRDVTLTLNRANLPFKLKVLNDPNQYTRCDAAVLYIRKTDYNAILEILEEIYPKIVTNLKEGTPVFTKRLATGVGLAENPGQEESFGLHRCQILAEGMIRAYEQGKKSLSERLQVVEDQFAGHGISLDKPFLNPGSCDIYHRQLQLPRYVRLLHETDIIAQTDFQTHSSVGASLRMADEIGQRLAQEAIWHESRCNWLGATLEESKHTNGLLSRTYRTLGADLYSGTSGVALFLAELHAASGDLAARRTALGAIQHALSHVDALPPANRLGLYTGWMGIALATARVGTVLGEEELLKQSTQLVQRTAHEDRDKSTFDLLSGNSGAIAALVVLSNILEDISLLDFAVQLGDELLQTADKSDTGYSWKSTILPKQRNLTGFSHGTAGVGYALLELFHATNDSKYRRAAEQAFNYERYWFDNDTGNWPDFREVQGRGKRKNMSLPLSFATHWCHGAPGIALSRLRAYKLLKDETCKAEAQTALCTTRKVIETALHFERENFSLCHGLAGNAEVLLYGYQVLGQEEVGSLALARDVADRSIKTYAVRGHSWLHEAAGGGKTPDLMLGLAGIGYFYLRLHNSAHPSVLILQPDHFLHKKHHAP
jgi:hypothetical protein